MTRQKFKPVLIAAGIVVALAAWLWFRPAGGGKSAGSHMESPPVAVKVASVTRRHSKSLWLARAHCWGSP